MHERIFGIVPMTTPFTLDDAIDEGALRTLPANVTHL